MSKLGQISTKSWVFVRLFFEDKFIILYLPVRGISWAWSSQVPLCSVIVPTISNLTLRRKPRDLEGLGVHTSMFVVSGSELTVWFHLNFRSCQQIYTWTLRFICIHDFWCMPSSWFHTPGGWDNLKVIISSQWKLRSNHTWVSWQIVGWKLDLNRHREWGWVFGEIWGAFGHDASVSKSNRMLKSFA